jgi:hypothetical protein
MVWWSRVNRDGIFHWFTLSGSRPQVRISAEVEGHDAGHSFACGDFTWVRWLEDVMADTAVLIERNASARAS